MNGAIEDRALVLVDANVIIESYRTGTWKALTSGHWVETVEDCVTETQTGFQRRRQEELIGIDGLRKSLRAEHAVDDRERAELAVRMQGIALDRGEESLWAHALGRADAWLLCGPDKASLRCGVRLGFRDRLISLQELLERLGHRTKIALKPHYTTLWLNRTVTELVLAEGIVQ